MKFPGTDVSQCLYTFTLFFTRWSVVSPCYFHTLLEDSLFVPCASALFRNGRAVQQEIIKGLEKGIWDWRLKELSLENRKMTSWLHGLQVPKKTA